MWDRAHSDGLRVPRSIKLTSVKPSGTVSILAGATPGVHWEYAPYYLRRLRIAKEDPLVEMCREAGYPVEPDEYADDTEVVSFPIHVRAMGRGRSQVSLWEKVDLAAQMQRFWSDNQVSCTADFDPEKEKELVTRILQAYEDRLKALTLLPSSGHGYSQAPYEEITAARYEELMGGVTSLAGPIEHQHELEARFCEGGVCDIL